MSNIIRIVLWCFFLVNFFGCGSISPVTLTVSPAYQRVRYVEHALGIVQLTATLKNVSRKPVIVVATPEGLMHIAAVSCNGQILNPVTQSVDFIADPRLQYLAKTITLRAGEETSFLMSGDSAAVQFDRTSVARSVVYLLSAPARCSVRFIYDPPSVLKEAWRVTSNTVVIDAQ